MWNRDDQPDQMIARNLPRAYHNCLNLYERYSDEIDRYPQVARFYYRKIFLLSISQLQLATTARYLWKFLSRGVVKANPSSAQWDRTNRAITAPRCRAGDAA